MKAAKNIQAILAMIAFAILALGSATVPAVAGTGGVGPGAQQAPPGGVDVEALNWKPSVASWYGPGFYGNQTACGQTLTRRTMGVANRTLPCGSEVVFRYRGHFVRTTVIDRGPYANGASWDLTKATADALQFTATGVGTVRVAKLAATQP